MGEKLNRPDKPGFWWIKNRKTKELSLVRVSARLEYFMFAFGDGWQAKTNIYADKFRWWYIEPPGVVSDE